jgi:hypothetical protein
MDKKLIGTVKVRMNVTSRDVENVNIVRTALHRSTNAEAVSDALATTAKLVDLIKDDHEILIRNKKGELERLTFTKI